MRQTTSGTVILHAVQYVASVVLSGWLPPNRRALLPQLNPGREGLRAAAVLERRKIENYESSKQSFILFYKKKKDRREAWSVAVPGFCTGIAIVRTVIVEIVVLLHQPHIYLHYCAVADVSGCRLKLGVVIW